MTETEYTLDQFELDFENAVNIDAKHEVLTKALDVFDPFDPIVKETLLKYRDELKDLKAANDIEEDIRCNKDIDSGELDLYTCIKESNGCTVGHNYYVRIDDVKSMLSDKWSESALMEHNLRDLKILITGGAGFIGSHLAEFFVNAGTDEMKAKIASMKPLIWIYIDNGIGTLKKKSLFGILTDKVFSEYFVKFENK